MKQTYYQAIDETLYEAKLNNGMQLFIIPKKGFQKSYVTMTAKYGSIHNDFIANDGTEIHMPKGIAHFLEHKMFEKEHGDMFNAFSEHGSSANAFTSYDRTSYLFTTVESLQENIKLLVDMLQTPWFTKESVAKEVGIIAEEIKMYQDQPNYRLYYQTLQAMYHVHPVRVDIAGTVDSIQEITHETLYTCYNTFYHPENMVMFIVGNVEPYAIKDYINTIIKPYDTFTPVALLPFEEPDTIKQPEVKALDNVQMDKIMLGIKTDNYKSADNLILTELKMLFALDLLFGEQTDFYQSLLKDHLIDDSFGFNFTIEPTFSHMFIAGASKDVDRLKQRLISQLYNFDALNDQKSFDLIVRQTIGEYVSSMNSPEYIANQFTRYYFNDVILFDLLPLLESLTLEDCIDTYKTAIENAHITDSRIEKRNG
ncbi:EF-P 5-aminopentanol modification-associated protein YfmH [Macrococcoides caseolyticum]|uniref:EF-P 5-aminopentanol modification-associated protein YfmH n=1 Tax=Macrococcoides caseolyticum TaxID=69966 RepID=UPI001F25B7F3|nr:pitrilysin family protein [Macrococcus caseolyticus]MCE4957229.1 insulinase family protein [Macrococcus caseolyticus]